MRAMLRDLEQAEVTERPRTVLADAGYWHKQQIENVVSDGMQVLVAPDSGMKAEGGRAGWDGGMYAFMRRVLDSPNGKALYGVRKRIEPAFGQIKHNRGCGRFQRRGRAAARAERPTDDRRHPQPAQAPQPPDPAGRRHDPEPAAPRTHSPRSD